jgi:TonB family protein
MRKEIIISLILHLGFFSAILFFGYPTNRVEGYPRVYQVGLVSLPKAGGMKKIAGGVGQVTEKNPVKKAEEGIAIKELQKVKESKKPERITAKKEEKGGNGKDQIKKEIKPETMGEGTYGTEGLVGEGVGSAEVEGVGFGSDYYVDIMRARIAEYWRNPVRGATSIIRSTIYFKIKRNGSMSDAFIEKTSGLELFDQAALRSVLSADPLPPLPSEYTGEELGVHLEFEYIPGR